MEPDQTQAPVGTAPEITVTGEVNAPVLVTLYDEDGLELQVKSEDVNAWLRKGFKRERWDVNAKHTELGFLFDSAKAAVATFVSDVTANNILNTASGESLDVAVVAMRDLYECWHQLHYVIGQKYGVKQSATESLATQEVQP